MMRILPDILNRTRYKASDKRGMTMAEMLITVAIIIILAAVAFISVIQYQRSLAQLERDKIAKDIYFAAQNHLVAARGEGYLELGIGAADDAKAKIRGQRDDSDAIGVYYFVHESGNADVNNPNSILNLMLPFGSIDETVRGGGSYIVRYNRSTGQVLDVFYCSAEGTRFGHEIANGEYTDLIDPDKYYGEGKKNARKYYLDRSVVGWYGGPNAGMGNPDTLSAPKIEIENADKLSVTLTNTYTGSTKYSIRLILTGKKKKKKKSIIVKRSATSDTAEQLNERQRVTNAASDTNKYTIVLDDITAANLHFGSIKADDSYPDFIPGEDVAIQAVCYSLADLATIEYSEEKVTNSLFASISDSKDASQNVGTDGKLDTVFISSIRHLENLDARISNLDTFDGTGDNRKLMISDAVQTTDLVWNGTDGFLSNVTGNSVTYSTASGSGYDPSGNVTADGCYKPVIPPTLKKDGNETGLNYDGKMHSITGIKASEMLDLSGDAGLFESITGGAVRNLDLIDFDIESKNRNAGALAGTISGTVVTNVIARNSIDASHSTEDEATVKGINAGGLIGKIENGTVQYSAAAVIVEGSSTAGGLVGAVGSETGTKNITGCYSAGHTKDGSYKEWLDVEDASNNKIHTYDVVVGTGGKAGGLIGDAGGAVISNSYSTCSVSGSTAGGFVGSASGEIHNSYSTGQVKTTDKTKEDEVVNTSIGAFAGSLNIVDEKVSNCHYYSIINEVMLKEDNKDAELDHYLGAVGDKDNPGIKPLDNSAKTYEDFMPDYNNGNGWKTAEPYDIGDGNGGLKRLYGGDYNMPTISQLTPSGIDLPDGYTTEADGSFDWTKLFINSHFGDWPAPEVFIVNE